MSSSGLALRKLTGCLQDAWSSVRCFGDEYDTISEGTGGARRLSDDLQSMYQLIFHRYFRVLCWFSRKSRKHSKNQWKPTHIVTNLWKSVGRSTAGHQRDAGDRPCRLILCGIHPQSTPHYSKHPGANPWASWAPSHPTTQLNFPVHNPFSCTQLINFFRRFFIDFFLYIILKKNWILYTSKNAARPAGTLVEICRKPKIGSNYAWKLLNFSSVETEVWENRE